MSRTLRIAVLATLASVVTAGCGIGMPLAKSRDTTPPCSAEFDIRTGPAMLGSAERFIAAARTAAQTPGLRITIAEVASRAGWSGEWDHMLEVIDGISDAEINAAAGTSDICYHPVRREWGSGGRNESVSGAYVFFANGRPVQSARWYADQGVFDLGDGRNPRPHPKSEMFRSVPSETSPELVRIHEDSAG